MNAPQSAKRSDAVRAFLLREIPNHPRDIVRVTCEVFGITRQAVNRYIREFADQGMIVVEGKTSQRRYTLKPLLHERVVASLDGLAEDTLWRTQIEGLLGDLPENVLGIWYHAFTEMVNNAIDHSGGTTLTVSVEQDASRSEIIIIDDGVGIFRKIKEACRLEDERHAVLELAKGKLTTDPERHTGEGIFFSSRMLDDFAILSGDVLFTHHCGEKEDWISELDKPDRGTAVFMDLSNASRRTTEEVFQRFAAEEEDYGFTKTVVPVRMARHGAEQLVSRSQAKRLLARVDRFSIVIFDFREVDSIGQAFADEIFRVFERSHPSIRFLETHTTEAVAQMIQRARSNLI